METVLVLGAAGMLGHRLCASLTQAGYRVLGTARREHALFETALFDGTQILHGIDVLDLAGLSELMLAHRPEIVVNCVGIVKQLEAANSRRISLEINALLPHQLADLCALQGAYLIHFSTDCVFSGKKGPYGEAAISDAEDIYGRTKFLGETDPSETAAFTIRSSIVGRELQKPGHGLIEWFLGQAGGEVRGFTRALYTGLTTHEMGRVVQLVIRNRDRLVGTMQVAGPAISKFDLLRLVNERFGLGVQIHPDTDFDCDRRLVMENFYEVTGYVGPKWNRMIDDMYQDEPWYQTAGL